MMRSFPKKFSEEEKTHKFFENSDIKREGIAVPVVPIGLALVIQSVMYD